LQAPYTEVPTYYDEPVAVGDGNTDKATVNSCADLSWTLMRRTRATTIQTDHMEQNSDNNRRARTAKKGAHLKKETAMQKAMKRNCPSWEKKSLTSFNGSTKKNSNM